MNKLIILFCISALLFTACDEVLDKQPLDIISDAAVWSDPVLANDYLNQCYTEMVFAWETQYGGTTRQDPNGMYTWFEQIYSLNFGDEGKHGWVGIPKSRNIAIGGGVLEWWGYPTVRKLNQFIENMESNNIFDVDYKKKRKAEARFLRAFCYFNMVKRYGGVPLITKAQKLDDPEEELYRSRDKEEVIYDFILSEIDAIANDLPDKWDAANYGRATKYAAYALKSRAAMYAGSIATWGTVALDGIVGISPSKATQYWQASYDASKKIITDGGFSLYKADADKATNFRNLFLKEQNSETIFSEQFNGLSGKGHSYDMWMVPFKNHVWAAGQAISLYLEMVESFDNTDGTPGVIDRNKITSEYSFTLDELFGKKDPRFKASVYTQGTSWMNGSAKLDYHTHTKTPTGVINVGSYKGVLTKATAASNNPFGVLKYLDEVERASVQERNHSDTDYIVFRLGEILLNYAEAAIELGNNSDALWAVNELRKRAGMPVYSAISRDLVRKERKVELAFEGNRYWDLRRWRIAKDELSKAYSGLRIILDGTSYEQGAYNPATAKYIVQIVPNIDGTPIPYFDEKHYYLPIGLSRTANNPKLVENPGYQ
jgi:hypothetical protein